MSDRIETTTLSDGDVSVTVLSLGCAIFDWQVAGRRVVLGHAEPEHYRQNPGSMGAVWGRVANRISNARFTLDGTEYPLAANQGPHMLHGGPDGIGKRNWTMERDGDRALRLTLHSPHLDQGFPGAVDFTVTMRLDGHTLHYDMQALPDRPTPINMVQHSYFNLACHGTVRDHILRLNASHYTPTHSDLIPTGDIADVTGTKWDFRSPRTLADADPEDEGWDGNLMFDPAQGDAPQVELRTQDMGLKLWTDQPAVQLYSSIWLGPGPTQRPDQPHMRSGGVCLEAQYPPDAVNIPAFGSIIHTPDRPYRQRTAIEIAPVPAPGF
ncbi:aldose epimerase family protein [Aestuariicoccus sp. MJ-SS9]|uniref:aldose epimerase family protein n=1 Tax=Aestuariicoccus sp. MJ-SS9 TaxID=3079855 RepID=UPI0029151876|nr:aldose epimerase family protein [Aestuariicoccus sp. MJ-SS9]MDU8910778.1 aldose epimerase family protein [Aestuariicoccus sp. MJ-SS9]